MDKQHIHIDDLVRQKLGGAEESDRPAPWLQMRELLDKEMPVRTIPAAFNWRRLYSAAAGLLLLASAGGGYALYRSSLSSSNTPGNPTAISVTNYNNGSNSGIASNNNTTNGTSGSSAATEAEETIYTVYKKETTVIEDVDGNTLNGAANNSRSNSNSTDNSNISANSNNTNASTRSNSNSAAVANNTNNNPSVTSVSGGNNTNIQSSPSLPTSTQATTVASNTSTIANNNRSNRQGTQQNGSVSAMQQNSASNSNNTGIAEEPILASAANTNTGNSRVRVSANRNTTIRNNAGTGNNGNQTTNNETLAAINPASGNTQRKVNQQIDSQRFTLIRDTFQKITLRKRYLVNSLTRSGSYITDTLNVERVALEKWIPKQETDPVLAAAYKKDAKVKADMVPLSSLKVVKSRKVSGWDAQQFKDIVRDAKFNMSQIHFYPGITAGVNASMMGRGGLTGFQLGMTSLFTFGEKWGASAELKYFQRFNGNTLEDNYYQFGTSAGNAYRKTVEHNFKFSNIHSLELPIALRYTFGRFTGLAGANLAYNFGINAEEFTRTYDSTGVMITPQYQIKNDKPTVGITDFNSRLTAGYLLGINYQVTPAIGLDMRMTQNVWNGMKGAGAQKVYNALYKAPSIQISVGYRFSNNPKFPKAR